MPGGIIDIGLSKFLIASNIISANPSERSVAFIIFISPLAYISQLGVKALQETKTLLCYLSSLDWLWIRTIKNRSGLLVIYKF